MQSPAENPKPAVRRETISLQNVRKHFGPTRALDGVSFSARAGEIHAVVGGNGCGKSTLAKVVSGILPVDGGSVSVLGETPATPAESRALGISTVYQEVLVADESSVVDNIFMGADRLFTKTLNLREKTRRAAALMRDLSGETVDPHAMAGSLPLSLKQWITIARGLLSEPRILILDESSAALDFDSTERLFTKMRELRDRGTTILIVTHRIAELVRIADRATVMRDGRDVGVLEREEITEKNLLALMTGEDQGAGESQNEAPVPEVEELALHARGLQLWPGSDRFDLEVRRGEVIGIVGLDGQGQDDLVRALSGVHPPVAGEIVAYDRDGEGQPIRRLADAVGSRVVYVSGDRKREGIFDRLSIMENMVMPLYREKRRGGVLGFVDWAGLRTIFDREADNLLIKFGQHSDRITSLSGGNQQKVLIGRGFAMRPDLIVLNDPARGIDVGAKNELYRQLRTFAGSGKSVIYLSSEIEEFVGFATRIIVFRDGAPFDAFEGRGFDPKTILESMFGQTDGSGLAGRHGLTPLHAGIEAQAPREAPRSAATGHVEYDDESLAVPPIRVVETPDDIIRRAERRPVRVVDFPRHRMTPEAED